MGKTGKFNHILICKTTSLHAAFFSYTIATTLFAMIVFNADTKDLIYPYNERMNHWTRKWGITKTQLNEAVLETGSINIKLVKKHLVRKGIIFSIRSLSRYIRYRFSKHA